MTGTELERPEASIGFAHRALLYQTRDEFVSALVPFVLDGLDADEPVLIVASTANRGALHSGLGPRANEVRFVDARDWYTQPVEAIGRYLSFIRTGLDRDHPAVRIVGEIPWLHIQERQTREWRRYEAAIGVVLSPYPAQIVCPYHITGLPPDAIETAHLTHPSIVSGGVASPSGAFVSAERLPGEPPRLPLPEGVEARRLDPGDVAAAVAYIFDRARAWGVAEGSARNLVAAAAEVVEAAVVTSSTLMLVATWTEDDEFLCQIEDDVPWAGSPLIGYAPPSGEGGSEWGFWVARHLVRTLEIGTAAHGAAVRLMVPLRD